MAIRNTAKAIVVHEGKILLNRCVGSEGETYFALPGGGQHLYETMEQAVVRECLEETGYHVRVLGFAALYEKIYTHPGYRTLHAEHAHRLYHIFRCGLADSARQEPTELDARQLASEWVPLDAVSAVYPKAIGDNLRDLALGQAVLYLGSGFNSMDPG